MTKNLFLKLNMAIVFVVVLFAGVTFADEESDFVNYVVNELKGNMSDGTAAILIKETLSSDKEKRVILELDSETIERLSNERNKHFLWKRQKW